MATIRVTREQQQAMGFNSPQEYGNALTEFENNNFSSTDSAMQSFESIKSSDLQSQPDFKLTPPAPPTQAPALQGQIETVADQFTQDLEARTKQAESQREIAQKDYLSSILGTQGQIELEDRAFSQKGGVDDLEKQYKTQANKIKQEQIALARQIERTQTTPGLTKGQVDQRVSELERVSSRKQADDTIVLLGLQGQYDTARSIADRAIAVQLERDARVNEALRIQYEDNKDLFNESEKRLFESRLSDRNRKLDEQYYQERAKYDQMLAQQDPLYQLQVLTARKQLQMLGQESPASALKRRTEELQALEQAESASSVLENKINLIQGLKNSNALDSVVGTSFITRGAGGFFGTVGRVASLVGIPSAFGGVKDTLTGERQSFIGGVEQLIDQEFLDKLIDVKGQGATFGALSNAEGQALRSAATKIGTWRIRKGDEVSGPVIGYNASEKAFVTELNTIQELTQKAYLKTQDKLLTPEEDEFFNSLEQNSLSGFNAQQYYGF